MPRDSLKQGREAGYIIHRYFKSAGCTKSMSV